LQGVLSYEERLHRAREELRMERAKQRAAVSDVEFWRRRAQESEAKLKMYEGEKVKDNPDIGTTEHAVPDEDRHGSPLRRGCEAGVGVEGDGIGDGAHEPSDGKRGGKEELHRREAETVEGTTVSGDAGGGGHEENDGADSAAVPPASVGEMSNASTRDMCWVEECGVYVLRQGYGRSGEL